MGRDTEAEQGPSTTPPQAPSLCISTVGVRNLTNPHYLQIPVQTVLPGASYPWDPHEPRFIAYRSCVPMSQLNTPRLARATPALTPRESALLRSEIENPKSRIPVPPPCLANHHPRFAGAARMLTPMTVTQIFPSPPCFARTTRMPTPTRAPCLAKHPPHVSRELHRCSPLRVGSPSIQNLKSEILDPTRPFNRQLGPPRATAAPRGALDRAGTICYYLVTYSMAGL